MTLLLTILSALALWALLTVLVLGLMVILKPLQSVRGSLERITMGVRAIGHQMRSLEERAERLDRAIGEIPPVAAGVAGALQRVSERIGTTGPGTGSRP